MVWEPLNFYMHLYDIVLIVFSYKKSELLPLNHNVYKMYIHVDHTGKTIKPVDDNTRGYPPDFVIGKFFKHKKNLYP